jgi:hypothetical protein
VANEQRLLAALSAAHSARHQTLAELRAVQADTERLNAIEHKYCSRSALLCCALGFEPHCFAAVCGVRCWEMYQEFAYDYNRFRYALTLCFWFTSNCAVLCCAAVSASGV